MRLIQPIYECKVYEIIEPFNLESKFMELVKAEGCIKVLRLHENSKYEVLYIKNMQEYTHSYISILKKNTEGYLYSSAFKLSDKDERGYLRMYARVLVPLEDTEIINFLDTYFSMQELIS